MNEPWKTKNQRLNWAKMIEQKFYFKIFTENNKFDLNFKF